MNKKGFTLVELLAVIAILAILVIMALPAVLRMFNSARKDSFTNEVNTIIRTARQQYLLSGGQAGTYSKDSNPLSLTGNSELNYCITINGEGQITELKATNGSYKYESNGIVDQTSSSDIEPAESGYTLSCSDGSTSSITYVNRQNEGSITVGDEVAIGSEHFYVISTDSTETVLLAKYNLLVGDTYISDSDGSNWRIAKILTSSDTGYGLQNETAKGYYGSFHTDRTGTVAFSGNGYWDNADYKCSGSSCSAANWSGLKSEYANSANAAGKAETFSTPYPYVYNNSMSSIAPNYAYGNSSIGAPFGYAQDNGYTIAYYIEGYINTLKSLGASNNITGRLLKYEEALSLSNEIKGDWSYWLGSAYSQQNIRYVYGGSMVYGNFWNDYYNGVRPVIVVSTSSMPN